MKIRMRLAERVLSEKDVYPKVAYISKNGTRVGRGRWTGVSIYDVDSDMPDHLLNDLMGHIDRWAENYWHTHNESKFSHGTFTVDGYTIAISDH